MATNPLIHLIRARTDKLVAEPISLAHLMDTEKSPYFDIAYQLVSLLLACVMLVYLSIQHPAR